MTGARKVALGTFIGTTIEWYDFFIYGTAAALVFPRLFFPEVGPFLGTILAFATFGAGFLARPLGGIVFGHFGDRLGRKPMLVVSLLMMGIATVLIGLLPTAATVGALAPVLLVLLRLAQGIAVGGEWGGAVLLAVEHAPPGRRGFFGSFPQAGAAAGTVLATAAFYVVALLPDDQFLAWGWRLPFLASAVLVVVGLYVRLRIAESPIFRRLELRKDTARLPLIETFRTHPRQVLLVAGAFLVQSAFAYIFIAYLATYATQVVGVSRDTILLIIALSGVVSFVMHLYCGALSDRFGRRPVYLTGVIAMGVLIFPSFALIDTGVFALVLLGHVMIFGVAQAISGGATATMFAEMFSTGVRYTGASVGYQLAGVAGAALSPIIAATLFEVTGTGYAIASYLAVMAVISLVSVLLIGETRDRNLTEQSTRS